MLYGCTSHHQIFQHPHEWRDYFVFCTFYIKWVYCAEWLYFLPSSIWTSPQMTGLFYFSTFVFCLFSCTFYIKWVVLLMWNGCTSPRHIFEGARMRASHQQHGSIKWLWWSSSPTSKGILCVEGHLVDGGGATRGGPRCGALERQNNYAWQLRYVCF
jgi:hypothetical protein